MPSHRKICTLDRLLAWREDARTAGESVVHCHGCFDIVHPGHVSHLQFAKSLGDRLVVTVSADTHVAKGVNRPLIPDDLRAANLAALECVDCVYVNPQPTAVELLEALRPDIYVKGKEYETNHDPRFLAERDTVIRRGGRVVFSSGDVVFSSTGLIGGLGHFEAFNAEKIRRFCQRYGLNGGGLCDLVRSFQGRRAVVIGDYVLDRYHYCEATGIASEGPMMTLRSLRSRDFDGGAGVIALHLAALGARATLLCAMADDAVSRQVEKRLLACGLNVMAPRYRRQVITKSRFVADEMKVLKVDEGGASPLDSHDEADFAQMILSAAEGADAVIFADFGYGLITCGLLEQVMRSLRKSVGVLAADASGLQGNLLNFRNMDLLCPAERELRQTMHDYTTGLNAIVWRLLSKTQSAGAIVTVGKQGLIAFDQNSEHGDAQAWERRLRSEYLPPMAARAVDTLGCGDALLATASLALAAGGSLQAAAMLGSIATAIEVEQPGNEPITAEQVYARLADVAPASVAKVA